MTLNLQDGWGIQALDQNQHSDRWQFAVKSGCAVSPGTNDLTVQCASGEAIHNGSSVSVSAQDNVSLQAADSSNPRKDTIYLDSNGSLTVATGTAEAAKPSGKVRENTYRPAPPDLSSTNAVVLAEVWVPAGASDITTSDVRDRRQLADLAVNTLTADQVNNRVQVAPSDDVQSKLNDGGADAIIEFEEGTYTLSSALTPSNYQTLLLGSGVKLVPDGDHPVIDIVSLNDVVIDFVRAADDNDVTTGTTAAVRLEDSTGCEIGRIHAESYANAVQLDGGTNGVRQCKFGHVRAINCDNRAIHLNNSAYDNHFVSVFASGNCSVAGVDWSTSGTDGGNIFDALRIVDTTGVGWLISGGEIEAWVGTLILDKCDKQGLLVDAAVSRLFISRAWVSSNGSQGVEFRPGSNNTIDDVQIAMLYAWNNSSNGVYCNNGTIDRLQLGAANLNNNNTSNTATNNLLIDNTVKGMIGSLETYGGQNVTVNGDASSLNVLYGNVGGSVDQTAFESWNGDPMPEDLTSRSGSYDGEVAYHDGTDDSNTNDTEPAYWETSASEWRGLYSGNVIA